MKKFKIGLQLYSVREEMEKDMDATLKAVKEMGYDYVEFAGFFGKSADEVKVILDKYDLTAISVHQGYEAYLEKGQEAADYLKALGIKYSAIPWMGVEKHAGSEGFDQAMADITKAAELLKENGIQMLYHNHDFEFAKFEDKFLLDWLYETLPAELMQTEIDTCWVKHAGYDPAEYVKKYTGRAEVLHLKDFISNGVSGRVYDLIGEDADSGEAAKEDIVFEFRPLGQGKQDFASILEAAEEAGVEYLIVEQDAWPTAPALESVKQSREYLKTLGQ